ncbi:MAG: hypothetical protein H0W63_12095 [Gemmatimonadaceae bacterium]|nr:hypothetical protein [Gemmatimonadaceae bacterium]
MAQLTWPYIHTLINHFPVVLSGMGTIGALVALVRKKRGAWLYTMATMTAAGLVVGPVYLAGDKADEALKDPWYIAPGVIDAHDAAANWALAIILITGAVCAYSWWRALRYRDEPIPRFIRTAVVISTLFSFAAVTRTAYLGGQIIHEAPVLSLPSAPTGVTVTGHSPQ